jgi:tubulin-specific chaperone A
MSDLSTIRRQLNIKSGVAQRLIKENKLYVKEAEDQKRKLDGLVAAGSEGWDINNGTRMMEEANKMITDSQTRLGKAVGDLKDLIVAARKVPALGEDEALLKAEKILEEPSI